MWATLFDRVFDTLALGMANTNHSSRCYWKNRKKFFLAKMQPQQLIDMMQMCRLVWSGGGVWHDVDVAKKRGNNSGVNFINVLRAHFSCVCFGLEIFWRHNIGEKSARKMLMKLTHGWPNITDQMEEYLCKCFADKREIMNNKISYSRVLDVLKN